MSLKGKGRSVVVVTIGLAALVVAAPARAAAPPRATIVELLSGYALPVRTVTDGVENPFGFGIGARVGTTLPHHLYAAATFVQHFGWFESASDRAGISTYRAAYHVDSVGVEAGAWLDLGHVIVRPVVGCGGLVSFGRAAVRQVERRDDVLLFYVAPGAFGGYRLGSWELGIDARVPLVPAQRSAEWAPAAFLVLGAVLD